MAVENMNNAEQTNAWVLNVLDKEQLVTEKMHKRVGLRHLGRRLVLLMWVLRIYVVVMLLLVAHQAWTLLPR